MITPDTVRETSKYMHSVFNTSHIYFLSHYCYNNIPNHSNTIN